jgi:steroid 5-alpha reductase family enzyme
MVPLSSMFTSITPTLIYSSSNKNKENLTSLDYLAIATFLVGFVFEAVGDHQLASFKSDPMNKGIFLRA